jgi:hypothetical protein
MIKPTVFIIVPIVCYIAFAMQCNNNHPSPISKKQMNNQQQLVEKQWMDSLKKYTEQHTLNTQFCFVINMAIHNGKPRFFIYNLLADSIVNSGLVANGSCNETYLKNTSFSNIKGSNCSSFGKYRIGNKYIGQFGLAYKLHGLDSSNSNAFSRNIVLHSHSCVPNNSIYPNYICNSLGCPTVSPSFLKLLQSIIDKSSRPIVLAIYP